MKGVDEVVDPAVDAVIATTLISRVARTLMTSYIYSKMDVEPNYHLEIDVGSCWTSLSDTEREEFKQQAREKIRSLVESGDI